MSDQPVKVYGERVARRFVYIVGEIMHSTREYSKKRNQVISITRESISLCDPAIYRAVYSNVDLGFSCTVSAADLFDIIGKHHVADIGTSASGGLMLKVVGVDWVEIGEVTRRVMPASLPGASFLSPIAERVSQIAFGRYAKICGSGTIIENPVMLKVPENAQRLVIFNQTSKSDYNKTVGFVMKDKNLIIVHEF